MMNQVENTQPLNKSTAMEPSLREELLGKPDETPWSQAFKLKEVDARSDSELTANLENLSTSTAGRWYRETILCRDDFDLELEVYGDCPVVHIHPKTKLTPALLKVYKQTLINLCVELDEAGYKYLYVYAKDPQVAKFAYGLLFEPIAVTDSHVILSMRTDQ